MLFLKDIQTKVDLKSKGTNKILIAYIKASLDITLWIILIFRISHFFVKIHLYPIGKIFWLINRIFFSVDIDPRAKLAGGLTLVHGLNIVIGHEVRSKGTLKIYQGVTIGGNMGKRRIIDGYNTGQPVIESGVTLGVDSKIFGSIVIGKNSIITTNTIITKNVDSNSIMVMNNKLLRKLNENHTSL